MNQLELEVKKSMLSEEKVRRGRVTQAANRRGLMTQPQFTLHYGQCNHFLNQLHSQMGLLEAMVRQMRLLVLKIQFLE